MKLGELDFESNEIKEIVEKGKKFWKVDVEFVLESLDTKHAASYNPWFDHIEFHSKYVERNRQKFPNIIDEEIKYVILHELGHAKEARMYEENGLFPWYREIRSPVRLQPKEEAGAKKVISNFFGQIDDFKVERKLYENGYLKPKTVWLIKGLAWMEQATKKLASFDIKEKAAALMNLPLSICSLQFCELLPPERKTIKSYYLRFLGKRRWKETIKKLYTLRFGNMDIYKKVVPELLRNFFHYEANLKSVTPKELELKSSLWKKQNYLHFSIRIPKGGMVFYLTE